MGIHGIDHQEKGTELLSDRALRPYDYDGLLHRCSKAIKAGASNIDVVDIYASEPKYIPQVYYLDNENGERGTKASNIA